MYFPHEGEAYDRLGKDIVPPSEFHVWELEVRTYGMGGIITLEWDKTHFSRSGFKLLLKDTGNDRMIDMGEVGRYSFRSTGVHRFRIYYGTAERLQQEVIPEAIGVGEIYPNPFAGELFIPLALPRSEGPQRVEVALLDPEGRTVRHLSTGVVEPGYQELQISTAGYKSGMYFLRIMVSTATDKQIFYRKIVKL
jgi:hypothetical protein